LSRSLDREPCKKWHFDVEARSHDSVLMKISFALDRKAEVATVNTGLIKASTLKTIYCLSTITPVRARKTFVGLGKVEKVELINVAQAPAQRNLP
jgi:hypothetical protein